MESALQLFGTAGYAATSIKQICLGAGLTERYFYESFPSREACLSGLYDELAVAMRTVTADAVHAAGPELHDGITAGLGAFIGHLTADPRRGRVVLIEVVGVSAEMEQRRHRVLEEFVELVMSIWSLGTARRLDRRDRLTAIALVGAVNHLLVDWIMNGRSDDPDDLVAVCVSLFDAIESQHVTRS